MSQKRQIGELAAEQEPFLTVRSLATNYSTGYVLDQHTHAWHQLLYASTGAMTVLAGRFSWMIPPGQAVFIPARCSHSIRMWGTVAMRSLYFPTTVPGLDFSECRVISVTPLLRELILRVVNVGGLDSRMPAHKHLMASLLDEIGAAPVNPLMLPMPEDRRALAVAQHVLGDPAGNQMLDELARRFGASSRTLERLFRGETGISFGLWRQKARMLESIRLLVEGKSVTNAAIESGYSSVSAFIAAFRQTFGSTPGAMLSETDELTPR